MKKTGKKHPNAGKHTVKVEPGYLMTISLGAGGMLAGFLVEVLWIDNKFMMTAGGLAGGLVGALCDTVLHHYRRHRQREAHPRSGRS